MSALSILEYNAASDFDKTRAYQPQEEEGQRFFDDGREIELLHFVYGHSSIADIRGSPQKVLQTIDEYGRTKKYMMNVGQDKGEIVCDLIAKHKPQIMVELGGYVGYSAILFGDRVRTAGGQRYYSLERSPEFAAVIMSLVDLAGLSDVVKVIVGPSDESLSRLYGEDTIQHIDLMFLDHWKPAYTSDLKLCEHLGLVGPGSVLAADNVIKPGNPPYLEYVRASVQQKREKHKSHQSNGAHEAAFGTRWKNQYQSREGVEKTSSETKGNPNLIYRSNLVKSFEPTGVPDGIEITECVGMES